MKVELQNTNYQSQNSEYYQCYEFATETNLGEITQVTEVKKEKEGLRNESNDKISANPIIPKPSISRECLPIGRSRGLRRHECSRGGKYSHN